MNYEIKKINIAENLPIVDELLGELHDYERELSDKTANWQDFRESYIRHMIECEEENEATFLTAFVDGKAVGFLFGYVEDEDDSNFEVGDGKDLYVSEGYVKSEYRKHGIYTALNQHFEESYNNLNIRKIYRFTLTNNTRMQRFLESQGYKATRILYEKWK